MEFDLYKAIENYIPRDEKEKECVEKAKDFLKNNDNCFSRTNLKGHITAGALVMDENGNVLLNHHKALDKWLLFGGHSDGESNSLHVAKREVMEESGIAELDDLGGKILDIDAHIIPENPAKKEPAHYHYDIRFLFIVKNKDFKFGNSKDGWEWTDSGTLISLEEYRSYDSSDDVKKHISEKLDSYKEKYIDSLTEIINEFL